MSQLMNSQVRNKQNLGSQLMNIKTNNSLNLKNSDTKAINPNVVKHADLVNLINTVDIYCARWETLT